MPKDREQAHAAASEAWANTRYRQSRVSGLAAMLQPASGPIQTPAVRQARMKRHLTNLSIAYRANIRDYERVPDDCRYYPHQSDRELARRVRQLANKQIR